MKELADALHDAAQIGPYFTTEEVCGPGWSPIAALVGAPSVNSAVVAATRRDLALRHRAEFGGVELRVAGSIHFLDVVARLVSPVLAAAVLADLVPALTPRNTWWRPRPSGAVAIGFTAVRVERLDGDAEAAAGQLGTLFFDPLISPLARAYGQRFRLADVLLWSNVASAVVGAAGQLAARHNAVTARINGLVAAVLQTAPMAGSVLRLPPEFLRKSCCLYYRLPDGLLCGDCVLRVKTSPDRP